MAATWSQINAAYGNPDGIFGADTGLGIRAPDLATLAPHAPRDWSFVQYDCVPVMLPSRGGDAEYNDEDCEASAYDARIKADMPWPGMGGSSASTYKGTVPLSSPARCTYTSWLVLHGAHNYTNEVKSMPLYREFDYDARGGLRDVKCDPMTCAVSVPLLLQFGWLYSDTVRTFCMKPVIPAVVDAC